MTPDTNSRQRPASPRRPIGHRPTVLVIGPTGRTARYPLVIKAPQR